MFKYVKKRVEGLFKKKIIRSVGILVGGTAFSQLIMLSALPFITRLYSPDDFSVLATYISLLALLTVIACLRFEIAIPIAKEEDASFHLFILSLISVIGITTLVLVLLFVFSEEVSEATNNRLNGYLWLIPIGVFFSGTYSALQYWMTREQKFSLVAKTRMTQSISAVTTQLVCGFAGISPLGLLLGHLLSVGAGVFGLLRFFLKEYRILFKYFSLQKLKKTFKKFDRFPKYSTWEALTNSAGIQIPILIIAALAI
ncbi:MAG TPA: oligosaccharide flippase family protein, partial [Candidatus Avacidaminococcus intestinavium]|nr:oligosaccharide flippase family protein [Candidatus Avacidaminococcus intestinavium]